LVTSKTKTKWDKQLSAEKKDLLRNDRRGRQNVDCAV